MPRTGYSIAIGAVIVAALVFPLPASANHVVGQEPYFTCQASVARATLLNGNPIPPVDPLGANLAREECAEDVGGLPDIALPPPPAPPLLTTTTGQSRTEILCATDDPNPNVTPENNEACDAGRRSFEQQVLSTANVTNTTITLGTTQITVQAANTSARARCAPGNVPALSSTSQVLGLAIGPVGAPVNQVITGQPNQQIVIPNLVRITLNELTGTEGTLPAGTPEGLLRRRAVHIEVIPGATGLGQLADIVIAESTADFHGDVCNPSAAGRCPPGTVLDPRNNVCVQIPQGGTLLPLTPELRRFFAGSPCIGGGFGPLLVVVGTNGPDRITGTNRSDRIFALGGNDRVSGGRGDDCVEGGSGSDVLDGSNGNDFLLGATGNDRVTGGPGSDRMNGGSGRDVMSGGINNDVIRGEGSRDRIQGGFGNDRLIGGSGNDGIHTGNGRDRVNAGSGNDVINAATRGPAAFVDCGPGRKDRVRINRNEVRRVRNCEFVDIFRRVRSNNRPISPR